MTTVVAVPYRAAGCPHRERAWVTVSTHLHTVFPDAELRVVDDGGEPFARGNSLNRAFAGLDPDTVVVACDADLIVPAAQLHQAIDLAAGAAGLVVPFDVLVYTNQDGTTQRWPLGPTVPLLGGCGVLTAGTWRQAGGWLPGFRAWGCEDLAMANQVATLAGPISRIEGSAIHLFHPKAAGYTDPELVARNADLMAQVGAAAGDPDAMRALLDELQSVSRALR